MTVLARTALRVSTLGLRLTGGTHASARRATEASTARQVRPHIIELYVYDYIVNEGSIVSDRHSFYELVCGREPSKYSPGKVSFEKRQKR